MLQQRLLHGIFFTVQVKSLVENYSRGWILVLSHVIITDILL